MPKFEERPDLLESYAKERLKGQRMRRVSIFAGVGLLLGGIAAEMVLNNTSYGLVALFGIIGFLAALGLGVAYAAFVFMVSAAYSRSLRKHGQTRPEALQVVAILILDGLATLAIAAFVIRDQLDARFWVAISFVVWTNIVASLLGYLSEFWNGMPPTKVG